MKLFVSSVRSGLEEERRALPGFIRAIGHEPVMFEDFGARTEPSRQECVEAVQRSDAYVLLLGPNYGYTFPETGQSATHDEYVAARAAGIPILVFRKSGVDHEPAQSEFIALVGDYSGGSFWDDYESVSDLQTGLVSAVRRLEAAPSPLSYEPLTSPPTVEWRDDWAGGGHPGSDQTPTFAELHVTPVDGGARSARQMGELSDALIASLRTHGVVPQASGVDVEATSDAVVVAIPPESARGAFSEPTPRRFGGIRVSRSGQVSAWTVLPHGGMGAVVDPEDLTETYVEQLRAVGSLHALAGDRFAISAGIGGSMGLVSLGRAGVVQHHVSLGFGSQQVVRSIPDESVSAAAFDRGAVEVARALASTVVDALRG